MKSKRLRSIIIILMLFGNSIFCQTKFILDFKLRNIDDKAISLKNFESSKGIILTFVSNACPVSEMYQKRIEDLQHKYASKGFPVIAIDPVDDFGSMKDTALVRKYPYYFLHDATQNVARNYKVSTNTHTFILLNTPKGFKNVFDGAIDNDYSGENVTTKYVESVLEALLSSQKLPFKHTKVIGCPISFRD
jgi:peroxiredoxin